MKRFVVAMALALVGCIPDEPKSPVLECLDNCPRCYVSGDGFVGMGCWCRRKCWEDARKQP